VKTLAEINNSLKAFEAKFGMAVVGAPQGSAAWLAMKMGVLSGSNASKIVAKKDSETRLTYMCDLVAEICTGVMEEMNFKQLEWGKQNEDAARSYYEFATNNKINQVSFVFRDDTFREGCSPDGLLDTPKGVEIKCPWDSANYVKFLTADKIKTEWQWQNQFNMRVLGADHWDFVQFDPRMTALPLNYKTVERDEKMQATLADAVPQFIFDMDEMLKSIGVEFGVQWTRIAQQANVPTSILNDSAESPLS
jgi:putative phage-type endonuclease